MDHDAIVIGSGAGGLAAAVALQRAGRSVLVLEQHYLPGGWCHSFDLGGYRFSPGVHYVGELGPGGKLRRVYEGLGVAGDLEFGELNPEAMDRVLVGGERFDIPKGKDALAARLRARFPAEAAGIDGYLDTAERMSRELDGLMDVRARDLPLLPLRAPTMLRWGLSSLAGLLDRHVRDPRLRAILSAQAGDHGLPPSLAPAPLHCAVAAHYFNGGYYPRGGGAAIPRAFIRALRRAGGAIRVRAPVERILVERRRGRTRAIGVRLAGGEEIRAATVISNADPRVTFEKLVGLEHLGWLRRLRLARTRYSVSALSLFLAVDMDLRAAGLDSGNLWWYEHDDLEAIYRRGLAPDALEQPGIPALFLTATTLKDPSKRRRQGHHTLEAFTFVPWEAFRAYAASRSGERPEGYAALKRDLTARMLGALGRIVPGIEERVVFADLGTPLTNQHYVAASYGNLYGTEKSRFQVGPFAEKIASEIDGLLLCGASTVAHGVFGATLTGLLAAAKALGCRSEDLLARDPGGATLRIYPSEDPTAWPEAARGHAQPETRTHA